MNNSNLELIIKQNLLENVDQKYAEFQTRICNAPRKLLGVRTPIVKKLAKNYAKEIEKEIKSNGKLECDSYFYDIDTYEDELLYGFSLGFLKLDIKDAFKYVDEYVKKIDNWGCCDLTCLNLKGVKSDLSFSFKKINKYLSSNKEYEIRFALVLLLNYFLSDEYIDDVIKICKEVKNTSYKMY